MTEEDGEAILPDTIEENAREEEEAPSVKPEDAPINEDEAATAEDETEDGDDSPDDAPQLPLASIVEAVLFAAREPLKIQNIARAVGKRTRQEAVREAIEELNVQYLESGRAFEIAEISGRHQLMSRPEYVRHIARIYPKKELADKDKPVRLTPSSLDTLSIIAYKQPVTRADIEHIRGCGCGAVLRALVERGSVKVIGKRQDLVGQPLLYGTTEAFLAEFGLGSIEELPLRNEFLGMIGGSPGPVPVAGEEGEARVLELLPPDEPDRELDPNPPAST